VSCEKNCVLILIAAILLSCAGENRSTNTDLHDIAAQWVEIEWILDSTAYQGLFDEANDGLLAAADAFYFSIQDFQKSEFYRTYRYVVLSQSAESEFKPISPVEISEVLLIAELAPVFHRQIANGDMENAMLASAEISGAIRRLLVVDGQVQRFLNSAYFRIFLTFVVFIAGIIFIVWRLFKALAHSKKQETESSEFSRDILLTQEKERTRISRELHDTIIQDMRDVMLEMEKIGNTQEKSEREKLAAQAVPVMATLIRRTRDICNNLVPPDFRISLLSDAIKQLCVDFGKRAGTDCRADIAESGALNALAVDKRLHVFRIVQEALANIEKHAEAKEAIVTMRQDSSGGIFIGISDDGKGFDCNGNIPSDDDTHLGIRGMKERAALIGGYLTINSEPCEGTMVRLHIPAGEVI
jgi:signal transduction histidine kinase